jgi:hypothetical protein
MRARAPGTLESDGSALPTLVVEACQRARGPRQRAAEPLHRCRILRTRDDSRARPARAASGVDRRCQHLRTLLHPGKSAIGPKMSRTRMPQSVLDAMSWFKAGASSYGSESRVISIPLAMKCRVCR